MSQNQDPSSLRNILAVIFVTVIGGVIVAIIAGEGRFAPGTPMLTPILIAQTVATLEPPTSAAAPVVSTGSPTPLPTRTSTPTVTPRLVTPTPFAGATRIVSGAPMVFIPAGEFLMGSTDKDIEAILTMCNSCKRGDFDDEKPQHAVYLDAFWIDKFEVTSALYKKCVDAGKCPAPSDSSSYTRDTYYGNPQFDNYPVIKVTWDTAKSFCQWMGKRLPTEAEWEKAARGANGRIYPWGNTFDKNLLNSYEGGRGDTTAVGSYLGSVSPYGTMDIVENVWEWVTDWYDDKYYSNAPARNPKGPSFGQYHVLRDGSWYCKAYFVHAAFRSYNYSGYLDTDVGFRCAQ